MSRDRKRMKAAEQDIELLLLRFTKLVQLGAELSFATFKRVWVDLHFSYIFLGNNTGYKNDQFIQCLYASALDGLTIPLWQLAEKAEAAAAPSTGRQPAQGQGTELQPGTAQDNHAPHGAKEPSIPYQDLSQLMLSDESDASDSPNTRGNSKRSHNSAHPTSQWQRLQQQLQPNIDHGQIDATALESTAGCRDHGAAVLVDPLADLQPTLEGDAAPQYQPNTNSSVDTNATSTANPCQQQQKVSRGPSVPHINPFGPHSNPPSPCGQPPAPSATASAFHRPEDCKIRSDPAGVPFVAKAGSLFALYCLFEAQPNASAKVPIYLPLELLLQLLPVLQEAQDKSVHDVGQVMQQLMKKNAFVVGAVRRPVRGSKAAEAAAQPPCRLAASSLQGDTSSRSRVERDAKYHMLSTLRGLNLVHRLHGMCQDYKAAKSSCFTALCGSRAKPPQGISKATLGLKLGQLLSDATKAVDSKLYPPRREHRQKRKRTPHDDAGDAEPGGAAAGDGAPVSDAELDSILETSMAALAEEEEEGEIVDELAGLEDEDCFETGMAGIRGKAARAVIQKDMRRKQQARAAELAWQRYEEQVLLQAPGDFDFDDEQDPSDEENQHLDSDVELPDSAPSDCDGMVQDCSDSDDLQRTIDAAQLRSDMSPLQGGSQKAAAAAALPLGKRSKKQDASLHGGYPQHAGRGPQTKPLKAVLRGKRRSYKQQTSAQDLPMPASTSNAMSAIDMASPASATDGQHHAPASSLMQPSSRSVSSKQGVQQSSQNKTRGRSAKQRAPHKSPTLNREVRSSNGNQSQQQQHAVDHMDLLEGLDSDVDVPAGSDGACAQEQMYLAAAAEIDSLLDEDDD